MKLEDRLRAELDRSARSTKVGVAPSVADLSAVASQRRQRNKFVGGAGALAVSGLALFGAFIAASPDDGSVVLVDGGDSAEVSQGSADVTDDAATSDAAAAVVSDADNPDASSGDAASVAVGTDDIAVSSDDISAGVVPADALQVAGEPMKVATRESAIEFSGGSGVLLVPFDGGFRGLASSFGDDGGQAIGISSANGLDWAESTLTGVPEGATASVLREHDGTYVALFEYFDSASGQKEIFIGTSNNLADWVLSDALEGRNAVATDLAVGSPGVIVIGDNFSPDVWIGPIGGPYEPTGQVDASSLAGVTTLGDEFLIAGRSADTGVTLFSSADGDVWSTRQLTSANGAAGDQTVSVAEGTIVLTNFTDEGQVTSVSSDGGVTWDLLNTGTVRSLSVGRSALGFIGGTRLDATVMLQSGDSLARANLDVSAPDRLSLLATSQNQAVMLVSNENGTLTWIVASR